MLLCFLQTLVVTAYQANCAKGAPVTQGFMNCGDKKKCIYQKYKCDKHYNCATDNGTTPADEMVSSQYTVGFRYLRGLGVGWGSAGGHLTPGI
jgi:hypothetical protein